MLNRLARTKMSSREGKAFPLFPFSRFLPEPARRPNRPPSDPRCKRHHGRFPASPNMAQAPLRSSAVPLRCFPPVVDLTTQFLRAFHHASGKFSPRGGSWTPAVSWRLAWRTTMRTDVMAPVARPTTVNAGAYHGDGLAACWGRLPSEPCAIARFIALK